MNMGQAIATCMGKYATFSGRASRSEFWWFYLFTVLISWGAAVAGSAMAEPDLPMQTILPNVVALAFIVPQWAVGARRLHDIGRSGWWQLIAITLIGVFLLIYWYARNGQDGTNRFDPPEAQAEAPQSVILR
jgi:uncharacterized membrane protein YhaH (DUF805 family)